jgi:D-lactate dehydrogenase (cytochrome)|nr:FAD-binding oxidoreductase [uncultured Sandarakinorhabdus sp.]
MSAEGPIDSQAEAMASSVQALIALLGPDAVASDADTLAFYSQDLMTEGAIPLAVAQPGSTAQMAALMQFAKGRRLALYPRGGGMSYSRAFPPETRAAILVDFSRLSAIRSINRLDGHVTVESGCTWAQLDTALARHGLRSRFWGPMSGGTATIGGALSNGAVTFGSGDVGASANSVKSFEIVTGTGAVIHTGSDGAGCDHPFNRAFGPDLTGLFAHDCGALGIKTAITLETQPRPALVDGLSFASNDFGQICALLRGVAEQRLASEIIAMDAEVARQNAGPPRLWADLKALAAIGLASGNPVTALRRMAQVALAGRGFLDKALYTLHFVVEARDADERRSRLRAIRQLAGDCAEIVNTVPLATRANPFPDLPVTHPDGRRMLPIHGMFAWSQVAAFHLAYGDWKAANAQALAAHGITMAEFFAVVAGIGILYEPVFYWADGLRVFHERRTPDWLQSSLPRHAENPAARALVQDSVDQLVALMATHGASHFQIGRLYPYQQRHEAGRGELLRALKRQLDPDNICNPGALGL